MDADNILTREQLKLNRERYAATRIRDAQNSSGAIARKRRGRPLAYSEQWALNFCAGIAEGKRVNEMAKLTGKEVGSIYRYKQIFPEFNRMFDEAMAIRADIQAEQLLYIADECNPDQVPKARLQCDVRKWLMGRLLPTKYGDHLSQRPPGSDGPLAAPIVNIVFGKEAEAEMKIIEAEPEVDEPHDAAD